MLPARHRAVAAQSSALRAAKTRTWAFPFTHVHPLIPVSFPKTCAAAEEGGQGELEHGVVGYPRGPPWDKRERAVGGISAP